MAMGRSGLASLRDRGPGVVVGAAAVAAVLVAGRLGALESAELAVFDRFVRLAADAAAPRDAAPVVLLSLGESDFDRHGYPFPDALLADCLARLAAFGATAIGVDLYRAAPRSGTAEDLVGWAALAEAVGRRPSIVATELLPAGAAPGIPAPGFAAREQVGFNNVLIDRGGMVRRAYLYAWDEAGASHPSLALRLASLALAPHGVVIGADPTDPDALRVGRATLAPMTADFGGYVDLDAGGYQIPLDFARDAAEFASVGVEELLAGRVAADRIAGRVVVVGTDAPSVKDDFNTPRSPSEIVKGHRLHAQITDQLIRAGLAGEVPRGTWSEGAEKALVVGFGLAAMAIALGVGALGAIVPMLVVGAALPIALSWTLFGEGVWLPAVAPALAWTVAGGASFAARARGEARAQRQLASLFRRFSSSEVAEALWRERDAFMEGGRPKPRRVVLTALMSDLVGYTAAAEKLEPERLLAWIDAYMDAMTRIIEDHGGHVDDYVGDGIKANFGVPIPSATEAEIAADARRAVACALAMGRGLERCNREWAAQGLPTARQRIGIATGPAVVGAIGSDARMKYTSVGDTINTAARLESFAEPGAPVGDRPTSRILVGESTRARLGEGFALEDVGVHALKGKAEALRIHRVVGARTASAERREDGS